MLPIIAHSVYTQTPFYITLYLVRVVFACLYFYVVFILVLYCFITACLSETHSYDSGTNLYTCTRYIDVTTGVGHVARLNGNNSIKT